MNVSFKHLFILRYIYFMTIMQRHWSCDMDVTAEGNFAKFRILDSSTAHITVIVTSTDNPFASWNLREETLHTGKSLHLR